MICILIIHLFIHIKKYSHLKNGNNKRTCIIDEGGDKNDINHKKFYMNLKEE